jgi:selenocysteine lyase/cysteine desulfurase
MATMTTGYDLDAVRAQLPALNALTYLNTGTEGILAEPALAAYLAAVAAHDRYGHVGIARATEESEAGRARLAALLHVSPDEIAWSHNATDGVNLFLQSIAWPMDGSGEVIISNEEHPAIIMPWYTLAARGGPRVRMFTVSPDAEETLTNFHAVLSERTVAIAVSHVSCETGIRLPIAAICRLAKERGAWTFVDGAQSVAQFDFSPRAIGADALTGNGHKWLCGPKGTGFLWVTSERLAELRPTFVGSGTYTRETLRDMFIDGATPEMVHVDSARRFEYGTRNFGPYAGLDAALRYRDALGATAIEAHQAAMSGQMKRSLAAIPGVTVHTPAAWEDSCGIVTFSLAGWVGTDLSRTLWDDHNIIQRRVEHPSGVRVSAAYFINTDDITRLCETVERIGRETR